MKRPRIVVVGSSNTDMVVKSPRIPAPGETILGGEFVMAAGGKGANQAVAAARLGAQVTFVARVGQDVFGDQSITNFGKEGIDTRFVVRDAESPSGVALILVDNAGENSIAVAPGANGRLSEGDVMRASDAIKAADVLLLQLEVPLHAIGCAARIAKAAGVKVILNPAPAQSLSDDLLASVTILTPNESETELLTGIRVTDDKSGLGAGQLLRERGIDVAIITRGARGSFLVNREGGTGIATRPVKPVDTTAAGDAFNGALAVALAEGREIEAAIRFASGAGALAATRLGAQPSLPSRAELDGFLGVL